MSSTSNYRFGPGWAFPVTFSETGVTMVEGDDDIEQSLRILFHTLPGERIMRPEYGCDLHDAMFKNIDTSLQMDIKSRIENSVTRFEPRVTVENVLVAASIEDRTTINIQVIYRVKGSATARRLNGVLNNGDLVIT